MRVSSFQIPIGVTKYLWQREHKAQQQRRGCTPQTVECHCWASPNSILREEDVNLLKGYGDKTYARSASRRTNRGNRNSQPY
jgi:hypothetical protein